MTVTVVSAVNPDDGFILSPVTHLISQFGTGTQNVCGCVTNRVFSRPTKEIWEPSSVASGWSSAPRSPSQHSAFTIL